MRDRLTHQAEDQRDAEGVVVRPHLYEANHNFSRTASTGQQRSDRDQYELPQVDLTVLLAVPEAGVALVLSKPEGGDRGVCEHVHELAAGNNIDGGPPRREPPLRLHYMRPSTVIQSQKKSCMRHGLRVHAVCAWIAILTFVMNGTVFLTSAGPAQECQCTVAKLDRTPSSKVVYIALYFVDRRNHLR
jgi:hypothetical protein